MNYFRKLPLLDRKKTNPYKFIYTGSDAPKRTEAQLFEYNKDLISETADLNLEELDDLNSVNKISWLNINGLHDTDAIVSVCRKLTIDNLVIQDILDLNQRPKFQEFDDYFFLTIKTTVPSSTQLQIEQISFVFNENFLISFQEKKGDYFEHLRTRLRENRGIIRERRTDFLLYTLLEATLDNYFRSFDTIQREVEKFELQSIDKDPSPAILEQIEKYKMYVHFINKAIQPIRDFLLTNERESLRFIDSRNLKFFMEIKDLCYTLLDSCYSISALLESSTNLFFSVQSHRMNQVMKTLTIVSTIFIPLTFIAGIYGMNFKYIPELELKNGYFMVWGLMIVILIAMIIFFKRRKWF